MDSAIPAQPLISDLEQHINALSTQEQQRFRRIFHLDTTVGQIKLPETMRNWAQEQFQSIDAVETQTIVKVTNRITLEGTTFNLLRASRPFSSADNADLSREIEIARGDPFCKPLETTPEDLFGRIRGRHAITASNIAKRDGHHGLIIFDEHHPLHFNEEQVVDYFRVALKWAKEAHNINRDARYFFLLWNCLWPGGASVVHGHAQVSLTRGMHYPKIEAWRRAAQLYELGHGINYFDDLILVHDSLGLTLTLPSAGSESSPVVLLAHLTPMKEREILVIGERPNEAFSKAVFRALRTLRDDLGTKSFSMGLYWRPIDGVEEDWAGFPTIARIVDRGDPHTRTTDIGTVGLYAISMVSSDPYDVARALRTAATD